MKRFVHLLLVLVLGVLYAGCYKCVDAQCSNVPPIDPAPPDWPVGDIIETHPDGSEAAASSPCGRSCANWKKLHCPEAEPAEGGATCYRVCVKRASLVRIPSACWSTAKDVVTLRACGGIRCVP